MDKFERKAVSWLLNRFAEIIDSDDGPEFIGTILKEVADDHEVPDDVRDDFKVMFDELVETAKESYLEYLEKIKDESISPRFWYRAKQFLLWRRDVRLNTLIV